MQNQKQYIFYPIYTDQKRVISGRREQHSEHGRRAQHLLHGRDGADLQGDEAARHGHGPRPHQDHHVLHLHQASPIQPPYRHYHEVASLS